MDLGPLRGLAFGVNLNIWGVPATVTRPAPDNTPVETRGIWTSELDERRPFGTDFQRREPRRVLVLPRAFASPDGTVASLPTLPRGTSITALDCLGGTSRTWIVDGLSDPCPPDQWRAIVIVTAG